MQINKVTNYVSVSPQIQLEDVKTLAELGFKSIICNRPDGEDPGQPNFVEIKAEAKKYNIEVVNHPAVSRKITDEDAEKFKVKLRELPAPLLAYCRTGTRSITLWSLGQASKHRKPSEILKMTKAAGYDMSSVVRRIVNGGKTPTDVAGITHDVVIIGAGAAGIAVASSLLKRKKDLDVAIIDPAEIHYYQPGWTMVGAGVFAPEQTVKTIASLIPKQAKWIKAAVAAFEPDNNAIILNGCRVVHYKHLIVCPGLKLDWKQIEGLEETLGKNGETF